MKTLTKAEEQVMQVLWKIEKGFLKDLVEKMADPKPHPNTVATLLKILVDKKFVGTETFGRMNRYSPLITKQEYSKSTMNSLIKGYFGGSYSKAVSFLVDEKKLSVQDLELLIQQFKKK